jgi:MFS family permease
MVGLERTVLPLLAEAEFGLASTSAALSVIATFGAVKAVTNLFAGRLSDVYGRRRVLLAGWLVGLPVPFLVIWLRAGRGSCSRTCCSVSTRGSRGPRRSS